MARNTIFTVALLLVLSHGHRRAVAETAPSWLDAYRAQADRLIGEATNDAFAWRRLATLTDTIGHRLSGSPQLEQAIQWSLAEMKRDGLENVHAEKVMVPKWIRGKESADIVQPSRPPWRCLASAAAWPRLPKAWKRRFSSCIRTRSSSRRPPK